MPIDADTTQSSRSRLLFAGKTLFSRLGYEQTSTATIAREAGTSESQLVRYFGGKSGLLEAVFNESWSGLNEEIVRHMSEAEHGREAILRILRLVIDAFSADHDIAFLFLFEGRRFRGKEVVLSQGFMKFHDLLLQLVARGREDGSFRNDVPAELLVSAMLGCAEGILRDRMTAERMNRPNPFTENDVRVVFEAMVNGLAPLPAA